MAGVDCSHCSLDSLVEMEVSHPVVLLALSSSYSRRHHHDAMIKEGVLPSPGLPWCPSESCDLWDDFYCWSWWHGGHGDSKVVARK